MAPKDPTLVTHLAGLAFPNPVGLAAGFDKDCAALAPLLDTGFGYVVGGTVTLGPRPGNPRPRLVRDPRRGALLNALGFPGKGLEHAEARLQRLPEGCRNRVLVSISGTEEVDILECHRRLEPWVAGIELNISSPNTAGLVVFQQADRLRGLVRALVEQKTKPLFIKLPRSEGIVEAVALAQAGVEAGAEGVVAANTRPVEDDRLAVGRGGLSGEPLFESTRELVRSLREALPKGCAVIACGGIGKAEQVQALMADGADAVQLYTAFVYEGPGLPGRICRDLLRPTP